MLNEIKNERQKYLYAYQSSNRLFLLLCLELCGTPGYLAPEILKCSMDELHPGYGKEVDL